MQVLKFGARIEHKSVKHLSDLLLRHQLSAANTVELVLPPHTAHRAAHHATALCLLLYLVLCLVHSATVVRSAQCLVHSAWCTVLGAQCVVRSAWCTVLGAQCLVRSAWCAVRGAQCVVHSAWCAVLGAQCLVHNAWCTVLGAQCLVRSA